MEKVQELVDLRQHTGHWRQAGQRIALVPTMGNLHEGHLQLVRQARQHADVVVVSIFVNPTQFGPNEDFEAYPRTLEQDMRHLQDNGVELLFAPTTGIMYPLGTAQCRVEVRGLDQTLCGASRPGHFSGVTTVVSKLFHAVQPDVAVFGEKDFQQLVIIRRMTRELLFPIDIVSAPISREADGLARSSRNRYLSADERQRAPRLYQQLQQTRQAIVTGARNYPSLQHDMRQALTQHGFDVDYASIVNTESLQMAQAEDPCLLIAVAARLGRTRLIDNVRVQL